MNQFEKSALQVPREYRGVQTTPVKSAGHSPIGHYYFGIPSLGHQGVECTDAFPLDMEGVSFSGKQCYCYGFIIQFCSLRLSGEHKKAFNR